MKDKLSIPLGNPSIHPEPDINPRTWGTTKDDIEGLNAMKAMMSQMK